ncbi:MAG: hypothetical protein P8L44_19945 [Opitutales bacterium]|nr:hypothetical protein [Opitutales bacterium]
MNSPKQRSEKIPGDRGYSKVIGTSLAEVHAGYESIYLYYNEHSQPDYYFQKVYTPVCRDSECKSVRLTIRWDLLGKYQGYYLDDGLTFTKLDHDSFTEQEYARLHSILADEQSILGSYTSKDIAELLKQDSPVDASTEVHALSGATPEEIRSEIIEGALYTCHTLWHLCRGETDDLMLDYTKQYLLDDEFVHQLLLSGNIEYIKFGLDHLEDFNPQKLYPDIVQSIRDNDTFVSSQIVEYLSHDLICDGEFISQLWASFSKLGYLPQRQLLNKMAHCDKISSSVLAEMIEYSSDSIESQFLQILGILFIQDGMPGELQNRITAIARKRKANLSKVSGQLLASKPYHDEMEDLRRELLRILN